MLIEDLKKLKNREIMKSIDPRSRQSTHLDNIELFDLLKFGRGISSRPWWTEMLSRSNIWPLLNKSLYSDVLSDAAVGFLYILSKSEEQTTDTELRAIAAEAIQG